MKCTLGHLWHLERGDGLGWRHWAWHGYQSHGLGATAGTVPTRAVRGSVGASGRGRPPPRLCVCGPTQEGAPKVGDDLGPMLSGPATYSTRSSQTHSSRVGSWDHHDSYSSKVPQRSHSNHARASHCSCRQPVVGHRHHDPGSPSGSIGGRADAGAREAGGRPARAQGGARARSRLARAPLL